MPTRRAASGLPPIASKRGAAGAERGAAGAERGDPGAERGAAGAGRGNQAQNEQLKPAGGGAALACELAGRGGPAQDRVSRRARARAAQPHGGDLNSLYALAAAAGEARAARARAGDHRRQTRLLARLVDDLLDVTRISSGKVRLHEEPSTSSRWCANAPRTTAGQRERAPACGCGWTCRIGRFVVGRPHAPVPGGRQPDRQRDQVRRRRA